MSSNSGHRRRTAYVERVEKLPNGTFKVTRFSTFTPVAMAGIGQLSSTLQSRCIVTTLSKATSAEQPDHLIDGESDMLFVCRRKFARWAQDLQALPGIDRPKELLNRKGDNWYPLRQIAYLAGGDWPARIHAAATRTVPGHSDPKGTIALLEDIWHVFFAEGRNRLTTEELLAKLIGMEERPWGEAAKGQPITAYFLREKLKPYFEVWKDNEDLKKTREWRDKDGKPRKGYAEDHFADAWLRHLQKAKPSEVRKDEAEAAPERREDAEADAAKGDAPSPAMAERCATSATSATVQETEISPTSWPAVAGPPDPRPPDEHPRQDGDGPAAPVDGRGSHVACRGSGSASATDEHLKDQQGHCSVEDVAGVPDPWGHIETGKSLQSSISHPRGAQSRRRRMSGG
jgi:hypothetical protein